MNTREYKIIALEEGTDDLWKGSTKYLWLQYGDKGDDFRVTMNGEVMDLTELWKEREAYVGGMATISYPYLSSKGFPIHAVVEVLVPNPVYIRHPTFDKHDAIRVFQEIR